MVLVIACSVLMGVAGSKTADHIEKQAICNLLLEQSDIQIELAESKLVLMTQTLAQIQTRVDEGVVQADEAAHMQGEIEKQKLQIQRLVLDREEIGMTGQRPNQDLSAPSCHHRDFVSERLELELAALRVDESAIQREMARMQIRVDAGLIRSEELAYLDGKRKSIHASMANLIDKMDLRSQFCSDEISAERVALFGMRSEAKGRVEAGTAKMALLKAQMAEIDESRRQGRISNEEWQYANFQMVAAETELQLAQLELQSIELRLKN